MCGASDIASYATHYIAKSYATHYIANHIYIYNCESYTYLYTCFNYSLTLSWKKKSVHLTHTNKLGKIFSYCSPVTILTIKPLNFQDFTSSGWQWSNRKWFVYVSLLKLQYSFLKKEFRPELIKALFPTTYTHSLTVLLVLLLFCILFLWNSITLLLLFYLCKEYVTCICTHSL